MSNWKVVCQDENISYHTESDIEPSICDFCGSTNVVATED